MQSYTCAFTIQDMCVALSQWVDLKGSWIRFVLFLDFQTICSELILSEEMGPEMKPGWLFVSLHVHICNHN